ncbi:L,D-transpeptidase Cds6 family protein [Sulfurimonas sp.]
MQNKKIFILLIFILLRSSLMASNMELLTHYRNNGIEDIQKQLDLSLTQKAYWNEYLKNIDTKFGYLESYDNVLTCDKSQSQLSLYMKDANNTYQLQKVYSAYTGKIKGDKHKEGDLKTPVGVYKIVQKISKVDSFYGPMAFVTSYPNTYDKYQGKTGKGIWIHGLPTLQQRDEFTKGCIAINNPGIECLDKHININKTLLIINESSVDKNISKDFLGDVLSNLYSWRYAWIYNDVENYLNFYANEFVRFDGMNLEEFKKYKKRIFAKNEKKTILFNNINVIPYPESENIYKITFKEIYKSNSFSFTGDKVLIVKLINKKINIITEK